MGCYAEAPALFHREWTCTSWCSREHMILEIAWLADQLHRRDSIQPIQLQTGKLIPLDLERHRSRSTYCCLWTRECFESPSCMGQRFECSLRTCLTMFVGTHQDQTTLRPSIPDHLLPQILVVWFHSAQLSSGSDGPSQGQWGSLSPGEFESCKAYILSSALTAWIVLLSARLRGCGAYHQQSQRYLLDKCQSWRG